MVKNVIIIIPARMESTRFPGKPLAEIEGKSMIQLVYEKAVFAKLPVYVATDSREIFDAVISFGGNAIMTSGEHICGTDRCAEAVRLLTESGYQSPDIVINLQCDVPFISPDQITQVIDSFSDSRVNISTLATRMIHMEEYTDRNVVKVIIGHSGYAYNFSRSPYSQFKHIGIYGYRTNTLMEISKLEPHLIEKGLKLEQMRWLMNNYDIKVVVSDHDCISIDSPFQSIMVKLIENNKKKGE